MRVTLKDGAPRSAATVVLNVSKNANTLEIGADGDEPAPIVLEFYSGKLTLRVYDAEGQPLVIKAINLVPAPAKTTATTDAPVATIAPVKLAPATQDESFDEAAFDAA